MTTQAKLTYSSPEDPIHKKIVIQSLERVTGRRALENKYQEILDQNPTPKEVWGQMVEKLGLILEYNEAILKELPATGPLIFIANHPFGVVDGIVLGRTVAQVREEFKFLVNAVLCKEKLLNQFFLPVDFEESRDAQAINIQTRKDALKCLAEGQSVVIFPSGGVATAKKFWKKAEELEWKRFVVKLIRKSDAPVVPVFFHGQNSRLFQVLSIFSMDLRVALLLNEVRNKMGKKVKFVIGSPIPQEELKSISNKKQLLKHLYKKVHELKKGKNS